MQQQIRGKAFVLGDNIDTDQIIPAEHLTYNPADPEERKHFGRHALSGVPPARSGLPKGGVPFVPPDQSRSPFAVVIAGRNFGCGSSREHAPLALAEAGCLAVVARGYARIFYRNTVNGAYLAPLECDADLPGAFATGEEVEIDLAAGVLRNITRRTQHPLKPLGDAGAILQAGGLFEYARRSGLLKKS